MTDKCAKHTAVAWEQLEVPSSLVEKKAVQAVCSSQLRNFGHAAYEIAHMRPMEVPRSTAPRVLSTLGTSVVC